MVELSLSKFTIILLLGFSWIGYIPNVSSQSSSSDLDSDTNLDNGNGYRRTKRNPALGGNGINSPTSIEGLLSSCQLTNLLLYQLLNQRISSPAAVQPGLGALPLNLLQPFPAAASGPLNIFAPTPPLQTYTTVSTYHTKMTTSSVHTITLLFGNKESTTVVTQTKVVNATLSTVLTLTSTLTPTHAPVIPTEEIRPTPTFLQPIVPTKYVEEEPKNEIIHNRRVVEEEPAFNTNPFKLHSEQKPARNKQHRRKQSRAKNAGSYEHTSQEQDSTPAYKFGQNLNFTPAKKQQHFQQQQYSPESPVDDDYYQQKDINGRGYYVRRLKRRGEAAGDSTAAASEIESQEYDNPEYLERAYLLEPSSDASYLDNVAVKACPLPKEITVTKTVTKYVNPSNSLRYKGESDYAQDSGRFATRSFTPQNSEFEASVINDGDSSVRSPRRFNPKTVRDQAAANQDFKQRVSNRDAERRSSSQDTPAPPTTSGSIPDRDRIRSINESRRTSRYRSSLSSGSSSNPETARAPSRTSDRRSEDSEPRSRFIKRITFI